MKTAAILAVAGVAGAASASSMTFNFNLENWGGSAGTIVDFDFALGNILSIDSVVVELAHSWASDIDFSLSNGSGAFFDLTSDNGSAVDLGDGGSTLPGVATYTFVSASGNGTWGQFPFGGIAPGGTYDAETWVSGPFAADTWNLLLVDDAGGDDGALGSITVNYTVPAPAGLAVLGFAGAIAARRRR